MAIGKTTNRTKKRNEGDRERENVSISSSQVSRSLNMKNDTENRCWSISPRLDSSSSQHDDSDEIRRF